jgi:hypothetical protein
VLLSNMYLTKDITVVARDIFFSTKAQKLCIRFDETKKLKSLNSIFNESVVIGILSISGVDSDFLRANGDLSS